MQISARVDSWDKMGPDRLSIYMLAQEPWMLYEHILADSAVQLDMVLYGQTFFAGRLIEQHNFGYVVIAVFAFVDEVRNIDSY